MQRRDLIKTLTFSAAGTMVGKKMLATEVTKTPGKKVLTIAHITDVHIREGDNAPERFMKSLRDIIQKHKPDFFLNGGDSIHDASYDDVKRERVSQLWNIWDSCLKTLRDYEVYSCIGNHDPWWKAPAQSDEMYGIPYVVKRLKIPHNYYTFSKKGWTFFVLDGNHEGISLGEEQMSWLKIQLDQLSQNTPVLLMSHYPILTVTNSWEGGQHKDHKELKKLFYQHKDKIKVCLSGHQHLLDRAWYNNVDYYCNGAMSGFWWGKGDEKSAAPFYYQETAPGYAILQLYDNGTAINQYFEHGN